MSSINLLISGIMTFNNLIVLLLVIMISGIIFLPNRNKVTFVSVISIGITLVMLYIVKLPLLFNFVSLVCLFLLLIGIFKISRDVIYIGAIFFIICCAVLIQLQFELPAKYCGTLSFFLLCVGVAKDVLYEKTLSK